MTRWFIIGGAAAVLVVLGEIVWPNFRFSVYLTLAFVLAVGLVVAIPRGRPQHLLLPIASLLAVLAMLETASAIYTELQFRFDPQVPKYDDGQPRFTREESHLGFGANSASATVRARRVVSGKSIYDVVYTIDRERRRFTRGDPAGPCSFLFFGDSFIFGVGLQDEETLPHLFSANLNFRHNVVNFGFPSYGPHQLLRALELGRADRVAHGKVAGVYINWLDEHRWRTRGVLRYSRLGPRYELSPDGRAVYAGQLNRFSGTFASSPAFRRELIGVLRGSNLFHLLYGYREPDNLQEIAYADKLLVAILARAGEIVREGFGVPLTVIGWGDESGHLSPALGAFRAPDVEVINKDELLAGPWAVDYLIPVDGHPSVKANREMAAALTRRVDPACRS